MNIMSDPVQNKPLVAPVPARSTLDSADTPALKRASIKALVFACIYLAIWAWVTWEQVSWPNRNSIALFVQVPAVAGLLYQLQYLGFAVIRHRRPLRTWPFRIVAVALSIVAGLLFIPYQMDLADTGFQKRQQPLIDRLSNIVNPCAVFKSYLNEYPPESDRRTPDLYYGRLQGPGGAVDRYLLAFRASSDLDPLAVYYHSGAIKWLVTNLDNPNGKQELLRAIEPMTRCDGPGDPIVVRPKVSDEAEER